MRQFAYPHWYKDIDHQAFELNRTAKIFNTSYSLILQVVGGKLKEVSKWMVGGGYNCFYWRRRQPGYKNEENGNFFP